jgi:hypothetical protein
VGEPVSERQVPDGREATHRRQRREQGEDPPSPAPLHGSSCVVARGSLPGTPRGLTVISGTLGARSSHVAFAALGGLCRMLGTPGLVARILCIPRDVTRPIHAGCSHVLLAAFGRLSGVLRSLLAHPGLLCYAPCPTCVPPRASPELERGLEGRLATVTVSGLSLRVTTEEEPLLGRVGGVGP